ncbi:MAG: ATP-dependent metallopeptidase FtsH/Yme1/Tma family protein [Candidatus Electrothrix sp. LOE1_4_5]|nr:ATP-dependent metallopeptidase FtsH/Yme1/Tma family protein [Candidatus Electrothrix sp. AX1]MCI5117370.1 ATP-dependent metallopeptidase FtsH/Yme1/Tma family protein [Candidatus Electrothrix gigas]MCI5127173.1 ATP-dependent metallopeptidase FtsH/Yme1/Tma family protein [Candidatus Electrothrix gigas]MCI5181352.1 ATP-dependent metallopeptidase FtsH/Yme1/Tma family protein [Candidatus Electrothrix gigas]MCI5189167.1 ATP-dependent metallopeptidase FtsH/Yme1/Tma family protein [Candidatus Electr
MNTYKNLSMWLVIGLTAILLVNLFNQKTETRLPMTYSQFWTSVENGAIQKVTIQGDRVLGFSADGQPFVTVTPVDTELIPMLRKSGVDISVKEPEHESLWMSIFISWFPMLLLIGVWIFFMRQMQMGGKGGGGALGFGRTRAKMQEEGEVKVTFKDVAGIDEAKNELEEIVDFLKDPEKFTTLGGRIPKGVLLAGSPGTGKTLLARAIAGEAEVPFFTISGSDFVEMFVGVGASRVRDLFTQGMKNAPCIIFIDEIDAVGRHRGAGLGGGHDEREQTLNQLLVEMDGFNANDGVIIIAATNRPDVLDPALLRPGRFDRQVVVPVPDIKGRQLILEIYGKKTKLADNVDMAVIARGTPGFSGADLENLVNEAALIAARQEAKEITLEFLEIAKDKIMMGAERKSMIVPEKEKKLTAYHEAGHAIVARLLPGTDPIHKVTIIPRGRAMGLMMQLPIDEKYSYSKQYILNRIAISYGGWIAEKLIFNEITTGAGNDIEVASEMARKMVCEFGMSDELGPLAYGKKEEQIFLGREIAQHRDYSEETARKIDEVVKKIILDAISVTTTLLEENIDILKAVAEELLEKETIALDDIDRIIEELGKEKELESDSAKES